MTRTTRLRIAAAVVTLAGGWTWSALAAGALHAATLSVPSITVEVVEQDSGTPVPGVGVELSVKPGKWAIEGRSRARTATDSSGRAGFPPFDIDAGSFVVLRLSWEPPGMPSRQVLYQFKARKGERTDEGRALRIGDQSAFYLVRDVLDGSCENLFRREDRAGGIRLTFQRPLTFSDCDLTHVTNVDFRNVGLRDINATNWNFYPFERDLAIGREFAGEVAAQQPVLGDALVDGYVQGLVDRLGQVSDMPGVEYRVQVIDADVVNAFALPGGRLFVYRGLIEATETEAELVGVLAHEIAHVTARHGTEGISSSMRKIALALLAGTLLVDDDDPVTEELIMGTVLAGAELWILKGSRKQEAEADRLGAQYAQRAGYDPRGIGSFFDRMSRSDRPLARFERLFASHPDDGVRVANNSEMVAYFLPPPSAPLITRSADYDRARQRLAQLPPPRLGADQVEALFNGLQSTNQRLLWRELAAFLEEGDVDSAAASPEGD